MYPRNLYCFSLFLRNCLIIHHLNNICICFLPVLYLPVSMAISDLRLILADDDEDDCLLFEEALADVELPVDLTILHDGKQLMQYLEKNYPRLPAAIFLDLNMPRKNGFECMMEIKQNPQLNKLMVIIFTTNYDREVVNQLYQNGAHYYIRKPAQFSGLRQVLRSTIDLLRNGSISQPTREEFVLTGEPRIN